MGHARYDDLRDLEDVLAAIRELPDISEPTPGIFYLRRVPFLHFHTKDGARWADAKLGTSWGPEIPIPFRCARREKMRFLREVRHAPWRRDVGNAETQVTTASTSGGNP